MLPRLRAERSSKSVALDSQLCRTCRRGCIDVLDVFDVFDVFDAFDDDDEKKCWTAGGTPSFYVFFSSDHSEFPIKKDMS